MISLPNNCYCSEPVIVPKNYKSCKKSKPWRVTCRFYDPSFTDGKGKIIPFFINRKKINQYKSHAEKKFAAEVQLDELRQSLLAGYNPRYKKNISPVNKQTDISTSTLFIAGLRFALVRKAIEPKTKKDIGYYIDSIERAAIHLCFDFLQVSEIKRKHIIFMLDHIRQTNPKFSDNTYNKYVAWLSILFDELMELEAVEHNPAGIKKKQVQTKERVLLTSEQRRIVMSTLLTQDPQFETFTHIFFHSGSRITELVNVRQSDVDLNNQQYRCLIKKGKKDRIVWRTIKNIALPYWQKVLDECKPGQYLFSKNLKPGESPFHADEISKRWVRFINRNDLDIKATYYSFKHLNTTEIVDHLDEKAAAQLNGHTSEAMVIKIYDQRQKDRRHQELKEVNNPL